MIITVKVVIIMFSVEIKTSNSVVSRRYNEAVLISEILENVGIHQYKPCGGKGKCKKCEVLLNGEWVLSCQTKISHDSLIELPAFESIEGIADGIDRKFDMDPLVSEGFGAAIDIGTTTIAGYIYKFPECELVKSLCVSNPQAEYGADVITRIEYFNNGGKEKLYNAVTSAVKDITQGFEIDKFVICANTTMLYLLTKKNPMELAVAPYHAGELFGRWYGNAYLMPCSSAYVGSDVISAALSADINKDKSALLVDIGTNGEMILKNKDKLYCCSTAAGPCFEGAGIACGIQAVSGAINNVYIESKKLCFSTIGNAKPVGICGTGLVDAIAVLLELGIIEDSGYMEEDYYFGNSGIYITPDDVRMFQLAKSAICSGIETLINYADISFADIETLYIAGGFGSCLNSGNAERTGIIPHGFSDKIKIIGNGAGIGASMVLRSKKCMEEAEKLASRAENISLSESSYFMDRYVENMMFEV